MQTPPPFKVYNEIVGMDRKISPNIHPLTSRLACKYYTTTLSTGSNDFVGNAIENSMTLLYYKNMMSLGKASASIICPACDIECRRFGKHRNGLRRFRCADCGKTYTEEHAKPLGEMKVATDKALLALTMIVEGTSV